MPVLLVVAAIFMLVYYSNYVADLDADQVTVIEIPVHVIQQDSESDDVLADEASTDEDIVELAVIRQDEPESDQAYSLLKNKQWKMAENAYLELIKNHDSSQIRADLAYIYYKRKLYEKALLQLSLALKNKPVYLSAYYYRAKIYSRMGDLANAEKDYLLFIKATPQHYYAHFHLAFIKYRQGEYKQAIDYFEQASKLSSGKNKSKALYYLAKSYQRMGEEFYPRARDAYQAAIRLQPGGVNPRLGIARLLPDTKQGRVEAEELYHQILNLKPNEARAYSRLATIYKKQGRDQEAQKAYERAVEFNPSNASTRYNLGLVLLDRKKWQEAADQFQAVVNINSKHARAVFNLGRAYYKLKNYDLALSYYQKALDIRKGDYPEVAINIGLIYSAKKDYQKAIGIYKTALQKNAKSAKLYYNLGLAYIKSGQEEKGMSSYLLAIKYRPEYAQAWYNVAKIHSKKDQYKEAVTAYKKALEIRPGYLYAQLNMAVALSRLGELAQAETVYRQVLAESPRYFSAWVNLGLVLLDQHRDNEAEDVFYQASQLDTEDHKVISLLARALLNQEKLSEAEKYYRIALDMKPDSYRYRLAYIQVLIQREKYDIASIEVKKGIKLFPDDVQIKEENNKINIKLNIQS